MVNPDRPQWAEKLRFWLTDDLYEGLEERIAKVHEGANEAMRAVERRVENGAEHLEAFGLWALCLYYGHKPVPDQCAKPGHYYCVYCLKPMPSAAHGPSIDAPISVG